MSDKPHVCPPWVAWFLASPVRKLSQHPERILSPYVKPGMTVADLGCALGFFSLPAARMVGPEGRVICVDLQEKLIEGLRKRARKAGLLDRLELRVATANSLQCDDLAGQVDFVLAFALVHEVPVPKTFFGEANALLKKDGTLLFAEPKGRVKEHEFRSSLTVAQQQGFTVIDHRAISHSHTALLRKT
jgi:ubiquinone/menaquinone biosynthesis C-methylase UbiE